MKMSGCLIPMFRRVTPPATFNAERAALARLQRSGFSRPDEQGKMQLLGQNAVLNFFAREIPEIATRVECDAGRTIGKPHDEEYRTGRAAVSNHVLGRAMV